MEPFRITIRRLRHPSELQHSFADPTAVLLLVVRRELGSVHVLVSLTVRMQYSSDMLSTCDCQALHLCWSHLTIQMPPCFESMLTTLHGF